MGRSVAEIVHLLLAAGWRRRFLICTPILGFRPSALLSASSRRTYETHMAILVQELAEQSPYLGDLTVSTRFQNGAVLMSFVRNPTVAGRRRAASG